VSVDLNTYIGTFIKVDKIVMPITRKVRVCEKCGQGNQHINHNYCPACGGYIVYKEITVKEEVNLYDFAENVLGMIDSEIGTTDNNYLFSYKHVTALYNDGCNSELKEIPPKMTEEELLPITSILGKLKKDLEIDYKVYYGVIQEWC